MSTLLKDLRYAARMLAKSPAFTIAAVICLALGIGATSAIFSVVHAVLLRPLGYRDPVRLIRLYTEFPNLPNGGLRRFWTSPAEYDELKRDLTSFESLDAWNIGGVNLAGAANPIRVASSSVTGGTLFFSRRFAGVWPGDHTTRRWTKPSSRCCRFARSMAARLWR